MPLTSIPAYVATVGEDHTVVLPDEIPVGSKVTITVIPYSVPNELDEQARRARFEATLAAIREASTTETTPLAISDTELDVLIKKARKSPRS
jgi:hypothetical protein